MSAPLVAGAAIVAALVAVHQAALPTDVVVVDGPEDQRGYAARSASVACPWHADQEAVGYTRTETGMGRRITEEFTVACSLYSGDGAADMAAHRADVAALLQALDDALTADPTLGGVAARARITDASWLPIADEQGTAVAIGYSIAVTRLP